MLFINENKHWVDIRLCTRLFWEGGDKTVRNIDMVLALGEFTSLTLLLVFSLRKKCGLLTL